MIEKMNSDMPKSEMRRNKAPRLAIAMALVFACAYTASPSQDAVSLRRALKEGDTQSYHLEYKSSQTVELPNGMGEQEISVIGSQDLMETIGKVDGAAQTAAYELKSTNFKIEINSPMGNPLEGKEMPKASAMQGTVDSRNRTSNMKGDDKSAELTGGDLGSSSTMNLTFAFPEAAVKIGDTWESAFPKTAYSPGAKLTCTLVGERLAGTTPTWVISMKGLVPLAMDLSKSLPPKDGVAPLPGAMVFKGTVDMDSEALVDKATCQVISIQTKAKSKAIITIEAMNADMNVTGESTSTMKRSDVK